MLFWACWNNVQKQSSGGVLQKKLILEISQYSQENICAKAKATNFIKKVSLTQMFSCEFCKIFKNIFSYRTLPVAVSEHDWFYKSSFWSLCLPRMFINLNMNDNKRKIGLGKKEMVEVKECFICKTLSIKWFLNFLAGWRIICLKSVKFFKK